MSIRDHRRRAAAALTGQPPRAVPRRGRLAVRTAGTLAAAGALIALAGTTAAHAAPAPPSTGATTTVTFTYTGAAQFWTAPAGVTSATFDADGASGGPGTSLGADGGSATGTLAVSSGQSYQIMVGGGGSSSYPGAGHGGGGFNGGGNGGYNSSENEGAGGGGGASDLRFVGGGCTAASPCGLADRLIVAAGAGGDGDGNDAAAGAGGGLTGGAGATGSGDFPGSGGGGGTQTAGGAAGAGTGDGGVAGDAGTLGVGGAGDSGSGDGGSGGGGGGGYYGGGGGASGGGDDGFSGGDGGGGSSYVTASATNASVTTGGGATPGNEGVGGNGSVTITYATPAPGTPAGLTATAGDSQVSLAWTPPSYTGASAVTGYNIYEGTSAGGESSTPVNSSPVTGTSDTVTGLTDGTAYYFEVTAVNADGEGPASVEATATPIGAQAITFTSTPPNPASVGGSYTPTATGGASGNPVTFTIDSASTADACSISGGTVSFAGAGTCTVDANQAGDAGYTAASQSQQSLTIGQASQAVTFTSTPPSPAVVGGTYTPAATGGGSGNPVTFSIDSASTAGACSLSGGTVSFTGPGTCTVDANQAGDAGYTAAPQVQQAITVDQAPSFVAASPATTATAGQSYGYTFMASGTPEPSYALSGAPSWLSVDASTGTVSGTVPAGTTSFSYSVTATNAVGTATTGPFTVTVTAASTKADVAASLSCPASLSVGKTGTCTLTVTNNGPAAAASLISTVALPAALAETSCSAGCATYGNVILWKQPSLAAGASVQDTVTVKATRSGLAPVLGGAVSSSPDPKPLNNIALTAITISR